MTSHARIARFTVGSLVAVATLLIVGACYVSKFALSTPEQSTVDRKFVGDWEIANPDNPAGPPMSLLVRNIDNHQYYVELNDHKDEKGPQRYTAIITSVKSVSFAQLRPFSDDGELAEAYIIMRVGFTDDGKLTLRPLADEDKFFKDKDIDSSAKLRRVLVENLDNSAMYERDAMTATRVQK
jgi:hypothetical protein